MPPPTVARTAVQGCAQQPPTSDTHGSVSATLATCPKPLVAVTAWSCDPMMDVLPIIVLVPTFQQRCAFGAASLSLHASRAPGHMSPFSASTAVKPDYKTMPCSFGRTSSVVPCWMVNLRLRSCDCFDDCDERCTSRSLEHTMQQCLACN